MGLKNALAASILLLLLMSPLSFAACPTAIRTIYLAAVTGGDIGGVFQLQVEVKPGTGNVYTAISPRTGFATQESEQTAVNYAFQSTGMDQSECDVLYRMLGAFGENTVDGPSAGGAMTVATRAALLGKPVRQDVVMTGTISPDGKIGPVGGIIEKSVGASEAGATYFLAPKLQIHEALLISSIARTKDFHAIEVSDVADAEQVLFSNYTDRFSSKFTPESTPIPSSLAPIRQDAEMQRFGRVASAVVDELDSKVRGAFMIESGNDDFLSMEDYFRAEIAKYRGLISMGYYFTAANSAFLLSIDAEYLKIGNAKVDLQGSFDEVAGCVASLKPSTKTDKNFHWAVGSDLRRVWAKKKLNETAENGGAQGSYTTLRDLLYAYSWCGISRDLASEASGIGGKPIDESALSGMAGRKLVEAEDEIINAARPDYDAIWHLDAGLEANRTGNFGAAIYEATYAQTMQKVASGDEDNSTAAAEKLLTGRKSLWGKIYYGQGSYLYAQAREQGFAPTDAYRVLKYSSELDKVSGEIDAELAKGKPAAVEQIVEKAPELQEYVPSEQDYPILIFFTASVALLGFAIVYRLLKSAKKEK